MNPSKDPQRAENGVAPEGGNPGQAGPQGALGLPTATHKKKHGPDLDRNEQRNFVQLSDAEREKSRKQGEGTN